MNTRPASAGCTSATASRACGDGSNFRLTELQSAIGRIQLQSQGLLEVIQRGSALLVLATPAAAAVP